MRRRFAGRRSRLCLALPRHAGILALPQANPGYTLVGYPRPLSDRRRCNLQQKLLYALAVARVVRPVFGCRLPVVTFCFCRTACFSILVRASRNAVAISADAHRATMLCPRCVTVTSAA